MERRGKDQEVRVGAILLGKGHPLVLVAGPCVIEEEATTRRMAERLKEIVEEAGVPFIFKSSYDKANRSHVSSFRGPGMGEGLKVLAKIKGELGVPVLSDVHSPQEAEEASAILDVLQIPAFLCRQTDLLLAAGRTMKPVNVKKGQFLAPWDMKNVAEKIESTGNRSILLTERGTCFGYNNLVVDFRSLPLLSELGYPVIFDATHSVQLPGSQGTASGGQRQFVPALARAAVAVGCDGLFLEVHEDPDRALCDGPNMVRMQDLPAILRSVKAIRELLDRQ
ncbi:MAG: 3-deoxy-8-phosphooctulonate synthase [candidate division NC10 bacterium]|nr:3-deoxy-8-phosphooctulonate synthase [candidate division NC10 bacterium]